MPENADPSSRRRRRRDPGSLEATALRRREAASLRASPSGREDALEFAIRRAAARLTDSPTPALDARVLMKAALCCDEAALIARGEEALDERARARFDQMVERRRRHEPVAHIVGRREFWSLEIEVEPGILVPRTESETLVEAVVRRRDAGEALKIIDIGSGSGALLCALLSAFPAASGVAADIDEQAVALTARNLARLGFAARANAFKGDWFDAVDREFDVIVANPPYIPAGDRDALPAEVRDFENARALFAGEAGLDAIRAILGAAPARLAPGGLMVLEFGAGQKDAVNELAAAAFPKAAIAVAPDLAGRPRVLIVDLRPPVK